MLYAVYCPHCGAEVDKNLDKRSQEDLMVAYGRLKSHMTVTHEHNDKNGVWKPRTASQQDFTLTPMD